MLALYQTDDYTADKDAVDLSWIPKTQEEFRLLDSDPCYPKIDE